MAKLMKTKTRAQWCDLLEGTDVCFAPVLSVTEAPKHPHNIARNAFEKVDGVIQPAPAPRFSRTPSKIQKGPSEVGADTELLLKDWGFDTDEVATFFSTGVVK